MIITIPQKDGPKETRIIKRLSWRNFNKAFKSCFFCLKNQNEEDLEDSSDSSSEIRLCRMTTTQVMWRNREQEAVKMPLIYQLNMVEGENIGRNSAEKFHNMLVHGAVNRGPPTTEVTNDYYIVELVKNPETLREVLKKSMAWRQWALQMKCGSYEVNKEVKGIIGQITRMKIEDFKTLKQAEIIIEDITFDIKEYIQERMKGDVVEIEDDI